MDAQLALLLSCQGGVATAAQVRNVGIARAALERAMSDSSVRRVRHGAYAHAAVWDSAPRSERYRLLVSAIMYSRETGDAASHHAALALHRLPLWGVNEGRVDVVSSVKRVTCSSGLVCHPDHGGARALAEGLPTIAVESALVLTAATSGVVAGLVSADAALARGDCTLADLDRAAQTHLRGHRRVRQLLELVDPRSESVGETRTRAALVMAGLPVRSQVRINDHGTVLARADLLVGEWVIVEFDGAGKYAGDSTGASLFREKQREDRLRELGYEVVRVTWADLDDPAALIARVRAAMLRAQRRRAMGSA